MNPRHAHRVLLPAGIACALLAAPFPLFARGGGGCLEKGTPVLTPLGPVAVDRLNPGDKVLSVSGGAAALSEVRAVTQVDPEDYIELAAGGRNLRLTAAHPVQTAPGVFKTAGVIMAGETVIVRDRGAFLSATVDSARRIPAASPAFNLLVAPGGTYVAGGVVVHNKGCFLPDTPIRMADNTEMYISRIQPGDSIMAFTPEGMVTTARVQSVLALDVDEYREIQVGPMLLRVTPEHPFYAGNGTFKTLEALNIGDEVHVFDGVSLSPRKISSIAAIRAPTRVYNLQTDAPNTFFANGAAVHNKGGGCFLPGTPIRLEDGTETNIAAVQPGSRLLAFTGGGQIVGTIARQVLVHEADEYCVVRTAGLILSVTAEHPFYVGNDTFKALADLEAGDSIYVLDGQALSARAIESIETIRSKTLVYNLQTDAPNTFFANGAAVHNKGGGGRSHSSRGGSSAVFADNPLAVIILFFGLSVFILIGALAGSKQGKALEDLDFVYSPAQVSGKSGKTIKLLEFLARQDPSMSPGALQEQARATFLKLQECWQAREYGPMKPLMMSDLHADHCSQLAGMVRNHEINVIEGVKVDRIDLVNVRYTFKENQREFTALITATAKDYYLDDRTQKRLRGDDRPAQFQEFWTFQRQDNAWLLREIEQSRESDALKEDNFFEQFTDKSLEQIYGDEAGKDGAAGPWLEKDVAAKETRVERLLNFLVQTDKIWDRQAMLTATRKVFLALMGAWEAADEKAAPDDDLFPELAADLRKQIENNRATGLKLEFRNLCVRKVELILVRNFSDKAKDEFVARVRAHAQQIVSKLDSTVKQDADVAPFEQFLTMGRLDGRWKLKEILPPADARKLIASENLDQDSNLQQLQWYYQHKRA
ncbi:MAG: TIM44-like domain-containing protein [Lentisphaerae bacterium]|nr:TIM44-like domain-containing protein [Lentisphaerota bacterium]